MNRTTITAMTAAALTTAKPSEEELRIAARARAEEEEQGSFLFDEAPDHGPVPETVIFVSNPSNVTGHFSYEQQWMEGGDNISFRPPLRADNDNRRPKLLIIGHGRHGKDTVGELLRDEHGFSFVSSSFFAAERVVRPALAACGVVYDTLEECYADRVNFRAFWYEAIKAYNGGGKSRLAEEILKEYDMYVGMRSGAEYLASRELFDHVLWVDACARGVPLEPRDSFDIDYDPETMIFVDNNGPPEELPGVITKVLGKLSTRTTA